MLRTRLSDCPLLRVSPVHYEHLILKHGHIFISVLKLDCTKQSKAISLCRQELVACDDAFGISIDYDSAQIIAMHHGAKGWQVSNAYCIA